MSYSQRWALLACSAFVWLAGCSGGSSPASIPPLTVSLAAPGAGLAAGANVTWTLDIAGGSAPYNVQWDFGGGANPNAPAAVQAAAGSSAVEVLMLAGNWIATATVTDAKAVSAAATQAYTVDPEQAIHTAAAYMAGKLTVATNAAESAELSFSVSAPGQFLIGDPSPLLINGSRGALVPVTAADPVAGAVGELTVHVTDTAGAAGTTTVQAAIAPVQLAPDTLYAIPLQRQVIVGQPVTVVVAMGVPANPFQYVNGVGLSLPDDAQAVGIDQGAVDRDIHNSQDELDGIWAIMNPVGLMDAWDGDLFTFASSRRPLPGDRALYSWGVYPIGGRDLAGVSGVLFNCQFTFEEPGIKTLQFSTEDTLFGGPATLYSDAAQNVYLWGNTANAGAGGIANSVEVLPAPAGLWAELAPQNPNAFLIAGDRRTWEVAIHNGVEPYTVAWDFGGGATPNTDTSTATNWGAGNITSVTSPVMNEGQWTARIVVTDGSGATTAVAKGYSVLQLVPLEATAAYADGFVTGNHECLADGPALLQRQQQPSLRP